ncbi:MAG: GIY-YIG nuclease family protein [Pacificimonas sp.]
MKDSYVYILASQRNGSLYVGVTSDLEGRVSEHRQDLIPGFTKTHQVHRLVRYEHFGDITDAIAREKQLKKWRRAWKRDLIERDNPNWEDLAVTLLGMPELGRDSGSPHSRG